MTQSFGQKNSISIIAPNIKMGGGLELLLYLYEYVEQNYSEYNFTFYIDDSLESQMYSKNNIEVISIKSSFKKIKLFSKRFANTLYFGNLPPLAKSKNSIVYFHNPYLLMDKKELLKTSFKFFLKYSLQQLYIKIFIKNVGLVAVQNIVIKDKFVKKYKFDKVKLLPFFRLCDKNLYKDVDKIYDFCYVSLYYPHKNHENLLKACKILADDGISFSLALTIESYNLNLINAIEEINKLKIVKIINSGKLSKDDVNLLYAQSKCLIFPSKQETFGLSLIEAANMNLDIIASNLPYTYESVEPSLVFDPESEIDIANTIRQYLKGDIKKSKGIITNKIDDLIDILIKG